MEKAGSWELGDGRWEMGDGRWKLEVDRRIDDRRIDNRNDILYKK